MTASRRNLADREWLASGSLARILDSLDGDGEEARVVGGAVRNSLLGEPVGEIDIATTARPDEILRRAQRARLHAVPTGIEHGTVTLIADGTPYEVTTLREDVETYGRKAKVEFGRDWRRDAERRDFTINALSLSRDGVLHDYVGGFADIEARRVRFIGDPAQRIAEDYLRIMRFFRFHAAYGEGEPDTAALQACIVARDGLRSLSRERVRMELLKLLATRRAVRAIRVMADTGLLLMILGGVPYLRSHAAMTAIDIADDGAPDPVRRLAALAVSVAEDAERLSQRLRLSNHEHGRLRSMAQRWWTISAAMSAPDSRALLYRLGAAGFTDRVSLARSRAADPNDPRWIDIVTLPARWAVPVFPVRAADLMARGVARGPALGDALRAAEAAWIAQDFPADSGSLEMIADGAAAAHRS